MANRAVTSRRRRRGVLPVLVFGLVVLATGWSALWFYARSETVRNLDAWIAAEASHGRIWSCADRHIDGFPFGIGLTCNEPSFMQADNTAFAGRLTALRADAGLGASVTSANVTVDLTGPLRIEPGGGQPNLIVSWSKAGATLDGVVPGAFQRGQLEANGVEITAAGSAPVRMERGRIDLRPRSQIDGATADLDVDAAGLQDADLNALVGTSDLIDISGTATINHLPQWGAALPTLLEAWRKADGHIDLTRLALSKGSFGALGTARLRLDAAHRIEGRLDGRFEGLEPIAARFGIPVGAVKLGGLLSGLLGGQKPADGTSQITLPLIARDGRLFLGPAKTAITLPPLY